MASSGSQPTTRAQTNGVLPIAASQTSANAPRAGTAKPPTPKLKVIIRRLAPGLTEAEFKSILGDDWKLGQGKVDWFVYKPGKDSKEAYLHLTSEVHLLSLSDAVRQYVFEDAQNTFTSPALIGPPTVEFAPYGRTPGGRRRTDARAGSIDQDLEFMAFLEGLANPNASKETNAETVVENTSAKPEKVTMTPLVQFLKDKKTNKSKEAAVKAAKKQEAQSSKGKSVKDGASAEDGKKRGKDIKENKSVEKIAREAVKILNREASTKSAAASSAPSASTSTTQGSGAETAANSKLDVAKVSGRQRSAIIAAHIRMLQRDLGLSPAQAHRQVRRDTADAQRAEKAAAEKSAAESKEGSSSKAPSAPSVPTAPKGTPSQQNSRRSRAKGSNATESETHKGSASANSTPSSAAKSSPNPVVLLKKPETPQASPTTAQPAKTTPASTARKSPPTAAPVDGATQAFVKHANPSQGVTETLLKDALEKFGAISTVEIDKRKGFAYVDFADPDGLKKAMAANPISVAQGTVQVMQRRGTALPPEKKPVHQAPHVPPSRGGRGGRGGTVGRRGGRGGGRGAAQGAAPGASSSESSIAKATTGAPTVPATK